MCAGFFDIDEQRAAAVSAELGVRAHRSIDEMIDAADAVCVVVPTPAHADIAMRAIAKGRALLVEKPLCATLEQADALLAAARAAGTVVQTGHVERFNRAVRAALPHIDTPRFISSDRLAPFNPRGADVAVVLDLMIHDIDLVLTLLGASVRDVQAVGVPVLTPQVDIANARLAFTDGAVATITASRVSREKLRKIRVFQRSGYLSLDLAAGTGEFYRLRRDLDMAALARGPLALEGFVEFVPLSAPEGEPLKLELQAFVDAVRGRGPLVVSGDEGRNALAVALQIMEAIDESVALARGARGA
jgi:predicted dehydrogenase